MSATDYHRNWDEWPDADIALPPGRWVRRGLLSVYVFSETGSADSDWVKHVPAPCGTTGGYHRHRRAGEETCAECRAALAEYNRKRRPRATPKREKPCGTHAAFNRHKMRGEEPCDMCRMGERDYHRQRKRAIAISRWEAA